MKLPVFKAVGMTFAFVAQHWLDLVKIMWLPIVVLIAVFAFIMPGYMQTVTDMATIGPDADPAAVYASMSAMTPAILMLALLSVAFYLVVFAGVLKLVIHGEKPKLPFYIGFGADELRLLGTWLLVMLMIMGAYFVGAMILFAVGLGFGANAALIVGILGLVIMVGMIWLCLRLSLATPAAIGLRTIGVGPSWNTAKGNVWRLFGYWLIWGLIFFIVEMVLIAILIPGYFSAMGEVFSAAGRGSVEEAEAASQAVTEAMAGMYDFSSPVAIARLTAGSIIGTAMLAVWAVAGGVAWRLMTDDKPEKHFE